MPRTLGRSEYCRRQAAQCAASAAITARAEAKEAYLDLEQAWLQLAPEIDAAPLSVAQARASLGESTPTRATSVQSEARRAPDAPRWRRSSR